jgi:hypothetical protein
MHVNRCYTVRARNVMKKGADNILKYEDFTSDIQHMWTVTAQVIPVITGATGTISKSLRHYLCNIPGKHKIKELHKTAILCTAQHTTESANIKVQTIFHGKINIICSTNCK